MKRKWRWVTRNCADDVVVWRPEKLPAFFKDNGAGNDCTVICPREFCLLFGFLPPLAKPVKVEFSAKVVR